MSDQNNETSLNKPGLNELDDFTKDKFEAKQVQNLSDDGPNSANNSEHINTPPAKAMRGWKVISIVLIATLVIAYANLEKSEHNNTTASAVPQQPVKPFETRLLNCNKVETAEVNEDFELCLSAAKDGVIEAQRQIIWAYSRRGEYQDWQQVFNWLKATRSADRNTQLLLFTILQLMGETPDLRIDGEQGITRLVTKNYAPANVILASIYALEQNVLPKNSNVLWLLERAYQQNKMIISPENLALIYANGLLGKTDINKATTTLKDAAENTFPIGTNNIAWFLATLDTNPFTSQDYPILLANKVIEQAENRQSHIYMDTLAAAHAANKNFAKAIETQQNAILLIENTNLSDSIKEKQRKDFTERLGIYTAGGVLVESKLKVDKKDFFIALKNSIIDAVLNDYYTIVEAPKTAVANTENNAEDATENSTEDKIESNIEENTNTDLETVPTN